MHGKHVRRDGKDALSTSDESENYGGEAGRTVWVRNNGGYMKVLQMNSPNKRYSITSQHAIGWNNQQRIIAPVPARATIPDKRPPVPRKPRIKSIIRDEDLSEVSEHIPPEMKEELERVKNAGEVERQRIVQEKLLGYFEMFLDKTLKEKLDARLDNLEDFSCRTTVAMKESCYILAAAEFKLKTVIPKDLWSYAFYGSEAETGEQKFDMQSYDTEVSAGELQEKPSSSPIITLKQFDARYSSLVSGHQEQILEAKKMAQSILEETRKAMKCNSGSQNAIYDRLSTHLSGQNRSQVLRKNKLLQEIHDEITIKTMQIEQFQAPKNSAEKDHAIIERASFKATHSVSNFEQPDGLGPSTCKSPEKVRAHSKCYKEHFEIVREQKSKQKLTQEKLNEFLQRNFIGPGFEDAFTTNGLRVCRKIENDLNKEVAMKTAQDTAYTAKIHTFYNHEPLDDRARRAHVKKIVDGQEKPNYLKTYKEPNPRPTTSKDKPTMMLFGLKSTQYESSPSKLDTKIARKLYSTSQERRELVKKFLSGEDIFSHQKPTEALKSYSASRSKTPKRDEEASSKSPFIMKKVDKRTFEDSQKYSTVDRLSTEQRKVLMSSFLSNPKENVLPHQVCRTPVRDKVSPSNTVPFVPSGIVLPSKPLAPVATKQRTPPRKATTGGFNGSMTTSVSGLPAKSSAKPGTHKPTATNLVQATPAKTVPPHDTNNLNSSKPNISVDKGGMATEQVVKQLGKSDSASELALQSRSISLQESSVDKVC
jgi:hypothetical protein